MSAELQAALTKLVEGLLATAEKAGQVGQEQLPLVIQEYLRWGAVVNGVGTLVLLALAGAVLLVGRKLRAHAYRPGVYGTSEAEIAGRIIFGTFICRILGIIFALISINHTMAVVKILTAPRVYLIEQLRGML